MPDNKARKVRGPSRPVDPRYAPGATARKGPDKFGIALVGTSAAVVLLIILWAALANGGNGTGTTSSAAATPITQTMDQSALATQQKAAQNTQVVKDSTETAVLPRIEPKDAIAEISAGNVKVIDVRVRDSYVAGHITGATNIPEAEAKTRLSEFPKLGNMIVYCQ